VKVYNNGPAGSLAGNLDISSRAAGSVGIGSLEGSGNVFLGANTLSVGSNNASKTFSGVIQDGGIGGGTLGHLTKTGTGTLTLTGANTYTGGTTVNLGGSLFVNNTTGSGTGTGSVTVNNTGTILGGSGSIGGGVIGNGAVTMASDTILAPGATGNGSTAILHTGSLTFGGTANFSIDLHGNVAGTGYDQVSVTGAVNLAGNLVINSASGLTAGDNLFIVENDGTDAVSGTFNGLAEGTMFTQQGDTFTISYIANGQGGGNDVELTVDSVTVPEPSTWVAGALMVAFVAYSQRRRFTQLLRKAA
jgi:autotransporter-associated beta strand protein